MTTIRQVLHANGVRLVLLPIIIFAVVAITTVAPILIPILNLVVLALSIWVCIAFGPWVIEVLLSDRPLDNADLMVIGVVMSWLALAMRTSWALVWRWLGQPQWMLSTHFSSAFIALTACAAVLHIIAPGAIKDRVPTKRWIQIGAWVAAAVFAGLLLVYSSDPRQAIDKPVSPIEQIGPTPNASVLP